MYRDQSIYLHSKSIACFLYFVCFCGRKLKQNKNFLRKKIFFQERGFPLAFSYFYVGIIAYLSNNIWSEITNHQFCENQNLRIFDGILRHQITGVFRLTLAMNTARE